MARRARSNADAQPPQPTTDRMMPATGDLPTPSPSAASGPPAGDAEEPEQRPTRSRGAAARPRAAKARPAARATGKAPRKTTSRMSVALEDSAGKPSRKSTRGSSNRMKQREAGYPTAQNQTRSPEERHTRNQTRLTRTRGRK